jgi:hypothetical protein
VRFDGDEPIVSDQNVGLLDRGFSFSRVDGTIDADVAHADGGFVPALEPIEECLRGWFPRSFELGPNLWPDRVTAERVCDAHCG